MLRKETLKVVVMFIHKIFLSSYKATIGADFLTKEFTTLQVWDTAGTICTISAAYYRGADVNYLTFEHLERWRETFLQKADPPDPEAFPFIVVGNKIDLEERVVSRRQARDFAARCTSDAERFPVPCIEASAKDGANVDQIFNEIIRVVRMPQLELDMTNGVDQQRDSRSSWPMDMMSEAEDDGVYEDAWTFRLAHGDANTTTTRQRRHRSSSFGRSSGRCC
ncbi:P-loop containing nucleoside triphosphate hydrolase protein [Syncephalis fuscata]|nr:P-loop containing nucleoside triphosphate hydrolase protein [Syncephalis fuscata]